MVYDPNGFPTSALPPVDPNASLNDPYTDVNAIANNPDAVGSIYAQNQVGFSKTLILNRVLNIIIKMISTLQQAAAAQANRLNFLTQWQKAYTDTMSQIHTFTPQNGDSPIISDADPTDSDDKAAAAENSLNAVNATYTTVETNRRSVISDYAKTMQTSVNQTADSVNAQSSLATSFLQTLSTLTSTIFKSS